MAIMRVHEKDQNSTPRHA